LEDLSLWQFFFLVVQNKTIYRLKTKKLGIFFLFSCMAAALSAQQFPPTDSLSAPLDSVPLFSDSLFLNANDILFSKDSLDAPVEYDARDSMILDIADQKVYLFGEAIVKYTTITLKADFIVYDWKTSIVTAEGRPDSTGRMAGFPEFTEGEQTFNAKRMRYNFQTGKGMVYDVTSQQNDIIIHGERSKFVRGGVPGADSEEESRDVIYSHNGLFTTCTAEHPHFGIRSKKLKIIPDKSVIVGPSHLEIMGVPTPAWLPFGFFPIPGNKQTGLLFPNDYDFNPQWGFGLRDIGWYFPLGEHLNLQLRTNIYPFSGTWGISTIADYRKRYKFSGGLTVNYDSQVAEGAEGEINRVKSFGFSWRHNQDRAAHPSRTFGGSVNVQTNNNQRFRRNDAQNVLQTQLNSNLSYNKTYPGQPYSFNASFTHSQNALTREMVINFPNVQFLTQALYPFKRKERVGKERWYESVVMRYTGEASNRFNTTDTTLFSRQTLEDAQFGVRHTASAGTSFKVLKFFNLNPGVNYNEVWYLRTINREFIPGLEIDTIIDQGVERFDTIRLGRIEQMRQSGFAPWRSFSASLSLTTQVFGTMRFKSGFIRGLRHVMKPSVSLNYSPNYLNPNLGYFPMVQDSVDIELMRIYSIFEGGVYGGPPQGGRQMGLSYSLNNIFEAKLRSRRDTVDRKIKLFDNLIINGAYNFAADSLKFSEISASGTARFFKGMTTFGMGASFDPYITDERGRRINTTVWADRRQPLRFVQANFRFNTSVTVGKIREMFQGKPEELVEDLRAPRPTTPATRKEEDFLSLFENFNLNHNLVFDWRYGIDGALSFQTVTNSINVQGSIKLTPNWNINVGNFGYDFQQRGLSFPSFGFSRDLHCWDMGFNWQPTRGTYNFYIAVKPGTLEFINFPYQQNNPFTTGAFR
jgi:lipopolysaccharide assembly outer membrane protein LptD (OstA)